MQLHMRISTMTVVRMFSLDGNVGFDTDNRRRLLSHAREPKKGGSSDASFMPSSSRCKRQASANINRTVQFQFKVAGDLCSPGTLPSLANDQRFPG